MFQLSNEDAYRMAFDGILCREETHETENLFLLTCRVDSSGGKG